MIIYGINQKLGSKYPRGLPINFGWRDFYRHMKKRGLEVVFWLLFIPNSILFIFAILVWFVVIVRLKM